MKGIIVPVPRKFDVYGVVKRADMGDSGAVQHISVSVTAAAGLSQYFASTEPDGTFSFHDVAPGQYVLDAIAGVDDYVKSILFGGQEVFGSAIDLSETASELAIIISKGAGHLDGVVQTSETGPAGLQPHPLTGMRVILASDPLREDFESVLSATTDQNGNFSFSRVRPGKYCAFASEDLDYGISENRIFLVQICSRAIELEVPEKGKLHIQLTPLSRADIERAKTAAGL